MTYVRRGPSVSVIVAFAVILWAGQGVLRGLWEPDEARYAYVATEMREGGRWLVPHIHGEFYPDKPPLLFWLINVSSLITGGEITSLSARLPSLFGAIVALWATARLMERWRDGPSAWRAAAVLMTSFLFFQEAGWGRIDGLLVGLEMAALYLYFRFNDAGGLWRLALAWTLVGLGMLAKGPVALAVPVLVYLGGSWAAGEQRSLRNLHWIWGPVLACAIPGVWLLAAWKIGDAPPGYFEAMFTDKSFGRVVRDLHHPRPWYYYLTHSPIEFLPWTLFLPAACRALGPGALRRRLVTWAVVVVVLFSFFSGKRSIYVLMAFPAAAMIVAAGWDGLVRLPRRWNSVAAWLGIGLVAALGVVEAAALFIDKIPFARWPFAPVAALMLGGASLLGFFYRRAGLDRRWFGVWFAVHFAHLLLLSVLVAPQLNLLKAPVELAREAQEKLAPGQPIHLYEEQLAIIPLYAKRPGRNVHTPEEFAELVERGRYAVIVFHEEAWADLAPRFAERVHARRFDLGSKKLVWVEIVPASPLTRYNPSS